MTKDTLAIFMRHIGYTHIGQLELVSVLDGQLCLARMDFLRVSSSVCERGKTVPCAHGFPARKAYPVRSRGVEVFSLLVHYVEQVRQGPPELVELPDDEHVARVNELQYLGQARRSPLAPEARSSNRWRASTPTASSASRYRFVVWRSLSVDTRM